MRSALDVCLVYPHYVLTGYRLDVFDILSDISRVIQEGIVGSHLDCLVQYAVQSLVETLFHGSLDTFHFPVSESFSFEPRKGLIDCFFYLLQRLALIGSDRNGKFTRQFLGAVVG